MQTRSRVKMLGLTTWCSPFSSAVQCSAVMGARARSTAVAHATLFRRRRTAEQHRTAPRGKFGTVMAAAAYSLSQHSSRQRRRMLHHRVPLSHATDKKPQPPIDFTQHQRFFSFTPSQVAVSSNAGLLASFQKRACMHKLLAEEPYMSSMSASIAVQPFSGITALSIAEPLSCSVPARATTRFCAFSVAELSAESPTTTHSSTAAAPTATSLDIYIEKGLGDAFRPFNITLSTVTKAIVQHENNASHSESAFLENIQCHCLRGWDAVLAPIACALAPGACSEFSYGYGSCSLW
eukprot:6196819-Pleurochrysis_carterae.AAC.2